MIIDHLNFLNAYKYFDKDKEEREVDEKKLLIEFCTLLKIYFIVFTK